MEVAWTIHSVSTDPELPPMYAALPDDGSRGLLIGEMPEVQAPLHRLADFMRTGKHDGEISELDPQLCRGRVSPGPVGMA